MTPTVVKVNENSKKKKNNKLIIYLISLTELINANKKIYYHKVLST